MSNGAVPSEASLDGAGQVSASPDAGGAAAETASDPGDFDGRFRGDPDWALGVYKKLQGDYTRDRQRMKQAERALQLAEALGSGDIAQGSAAAETYLQQYNSVRSNPKMRAMVDQFLATGDVPTAEAVAEASEPDPYEDPRDKEVRELRGLVAQQSATLARLEGRSVESELERHLDRFFGEWPLEKSEQAEVLAGLMADFKGWMQTPNGRETLKNPTYDLVETVALKKLKTRLPEIGLRLARASQEKKQAQATDAGAPVRTTGQEAIAASGMSPLDVVRRKAQELGIDPSRPGWHRGR